MITVPNGGNTNRRTWRTTGSGRQFTVTTLVETPNRGLACRGPGSDTTNGRRSRRHQADVCFVDGGGARYQNLRDTHGANRGNGSWGHHQNRIGQFHTKSYKKIVRTNQSLRRRSTRFALLIEGWASDRVGDTAGGRGTVSLLLVNY